MKKLRQKKWFRSLFSKQKYYLINGNWVKDSEFKVGDKIEAVEGPWHTLFFCSCGNELSHSNSFIVPDRHTGVWEYKCTHCGKHQYKNGSLGPFVIDSDEYGTPLGI